MSPTPPAKIPGLQPGGDKIDMAGPEDSLALPAEDLDAWEGPSP